MLAIFDLPYRMFLCIYGQVKTGFRGNPIKGASFADTTARLGIHRTRFAKAALAHMRSNPEIAAMLDEKWLAPSPDIPALLALPEGTLGHAYATIITENSYDPEFYDAIPTDDDAGYVGMRMRQTHDLWHTVTGIGTDYFGEVALQACMVAQLHLGLSALQLAVTLLRTVLRSPGDLAQIMAHLVQGYLIGRQARPLLAAKFEAGWERPLAAWRAELGIVETPAWLQAELYPARASAARRQAEARPAAEPVTGEIALA